MKRAEVSTFKNVVKHQILSIKYLQKDWKVLILECKNLKKRKPGRSLTCSTGEEINLRSSG